MQANTDPYKFLIDENWAIIERAYSDFQNKNPIIEYDIAESKIIAYPGMEYIESLSSRTRQKTKERYLETILKKDMMVFIKDSDNKKLRSYIFTKRKKGN